MWKQLLSSLLDKMIYFGAATKKGVQNKLCEEFFALVSNYDWLCEMKHAGYGVSVCLISKVMTSYKLFVRNRKKEEKKFILTVSQAL